MINNLSTYWIIYDWLSQNLNILEYNQIFKCGLLLTFFYAVKKTFFYTNCSKIKIRTLYLKDLIFFTQTKTHLLLCQNYFIMLNIIS